MCRCMQTERRQDMEQNNEKFEVFIGCEHTGGVHGPSNEPNLSTDPGPAFFQVHGSKNEKHTTHS